MGLVSTSLQLSWRGGARQAAWSDNPGPLPASVKYRLQPWLGILILPGTGAPNSPSVLPAGLFSKTSPNYPWVGGRGHEAVHSQREGVYPCL